MAEYSGKDLVVEFGVIDISGNARTAEVTETAGAPETIDVTHKGDSARQIIEGFPGAVETNVTVSVLDDNATAIGPAFATQTFNSKDTLLIYPRGKTHAYQLITVNNARLHERTKPIPYDGAVEYSASFNAKNSLTLGTYTTVT